MQVTDYMIQAIARLGTRSVFGYIGARNILLVESVYNNPDCEFVNVHHEHTAAFAACAYAQVSGKPGVAMSTSGPGGTNMLTGVAQAWCDSIPVLFITGQAATGALRESANIRNRATQEVDIVGMARPVAKYAVQILKAGDIRYEFEKAVSIATSGRPGPVLIDLPEDIQRAEVDPDALTGYRPTAEELTPPPPMRTLSEFIAASNRPIVVAGNGAHGFNSEIAALNIPIVASMSATDVCANDSPLYLGVCGNSGLRCANFALANADLIIALGCTMSGRYTGNNLVLFASEAKVVRVDFDAGELADRTIKPDELKINCGLRAFFHAAKNVLGLLQPGADWLAYCSGLKSKYYAESAFLEPYAYVRAMNELRKPCDIVCADVGNHQVWAIQGLTFKEGQRFISTSGLSTMGYAFPAAIGAYYARKDADILCVLGDGGLQMTIQELEFLKRTGAPVTLVLFNNASLGMIKALQDTYYGGNHVASVIDYSVPDFTAVARAYGLNAATVDTVDDFKREFAKRGGAPLLIEIKVDRKYDVQPRITSRRPIWDMFPLLADDEIAANMLVPYERKHAS